MTLPPTSLYENMVIAMGSHNRKNLRLPQYDYSAPGGVFVTLCTKDKKCILSRIEPGDESTRAKVVLSTLGHFARETLLSLESHFDVHIDSYVIMPNHIHIILLLNESKNGKTTGQIIGAYKSLVVKQWRDHCNLHGLESGTIWQRNYYDHVLRNSLDHLEKKKYIDENPDKWCLDDEYIPST